MRRQLPLLAPLFMLLAFLLALFAAPAGAAEPMEPEKAYPFTARALDPDTIEVRFDIAPDYYLYRDKFRFAAAPDGVELGEAQLPPGKVKHDEFFGDVATYRDELRFLVPVKAPEGVKNVRLTLTFQGCWDGGICFPPVTQGVDVDLAATPAPAATNLLDRVLGRAGEAAPPALDTTPQAAGGDESGRIARLLSGASVPLVLASFFGFGLALAFTPCMFPMIPILSGIIVGHAEHLSRARSLALSAAYVLGMAVTYAAAGVAAGLSGTMLSAALQNVWVLTAFAVVFVLLALSMFGFYELQMPTALQSRLADTASHRKRGSVGGVMTMGALSALIVGPCVAAPLAGALLYIAHTRDALLGGAALFAMALGMGAPLLVLGVAARSVLPKVGPWMEGVKKAFGVILLGVALWLVGPVMPPLAAMLGWAALLVFSGVFLHAIDPLPAPAHGWQRFWKGVGVVMLVAGLSMLVGALAGSRDPLQPLAILRAGVGTGAAAEASATGPRFERVASVAELDTRLGAAGRPVMLDFYADWCVSCKEMERFTFADPAVRARLDRMLLLRADVTANNDDDKALLKRFGLFGPPGIIFFDAAGKERAAPRVVGFMAAEPFAAALDEALR